MITSSTDTGDTVFLSLLLRNLRLTLFYVALGPHRDLASSQFAMDVDVFDRPGSFRNRRVVCGVRLPASVDVLNMQFGSNIYITAAQVVPLA